MYIYSVDCKKISNATNLPLLWLSISLCVHTLVPAALTDAMKKAKQWNKFESFCIHFLSTTHFWLVKEKLAQWKCLQFYLNTDVMLFIQGCSDEHLAMVAVCSSFQQNLWCEQKVMCTTSNASTASSADSSSAKVTIVQ